MHYFSAPETACEKQHSKNRLWDNWLLDCTILSKDKTIREAAATELAKRRLPLHKLAVQHLSAEEQKEFGLSDPSRTMCQKSKAVYQALAARITVYSRLDCYRIESVYTFHVYTYVVVKLDVLNNLYNAGFRCVDTPLSVSRLSPIGKFVSGGATPLHHLVAQAIAVDDYLFRRDSDTMRCAIRFFLDRGGKPVFDYRSFY